MNCIVVFTEYLCYINQKVKNEFFAEILCDFVMPAEAGDEIM